MAFDSTKVKWSHQEFYLNGQLVTAFTALKYKTSREVEEIYGAGDDPIDLQAGNKSHSGTVTVYEDVVNAMNKAAVAAGFDDLTDVPWTISSSYKATITQPRQTDTLENVRITEYEKGMEQNAKGMPIALPFKALRKKAT
ncbi:MAG: hypothetical protein ACK4EY_15125 [Flavipsychrobacter sp.]